MKQIGDLLTQISSAYEFKLNKDNGNKNDVDVYIIFIRTLKVLSDTIDNLKINLIKYSIAATIDKTADKINTINNILEKCERVMIEKIQSIDVSMRDSQIYSNLYKLIKDCEPITLTYINSRKMYYVESIEL